MSAFIEGVGTTPAAAGITGVTPYQGFPLFYPGNPSAFPCSSAIDPALRVCSFIGALHAHVLQLVVRVQKTRLLQEQYTNSNSPWQGYFERVGARARASATDSPSSTY